MTESSVSKLFGLPKPLTGALAGIRLYIFIIILSFLTKFEPLGWAILLPGLWASHRVDNAFLSAILFYVIPGIPFALCGLLMYSEPDWKKAIGFFGLIIYFALVMTVGVSIVGLLSD